MLKVAGKRASGGVRPCDHGFSLNLSYEEVGRAEDLLYPVQNLSSENNLELPEMSDLFSPLELSPAQVLDRVADLTRFVKRQDRRHESHREIAAVLAGPDGDLLGYGINSNAENKTLHAEVNLVQKLFRTKRMKIPPGSVFYSTHKPCKMCAGMLHDWCEDPSSVRVFYRHEEKGSLSRHTVLDQIGTQICIEGDGD